MDRIAKGLNPRTNKSYHPAIVAALSLARNKMNRYYSLTDSSVAYCIAMVLHLGMKLEYFKLNDWESDWIEQAESLVRDEYKSQYAPKATATVQTASVPDKNDDFTDFGNVSVTAAACACELNEYLCGPVKAVAEPLQWWYHNRFVYPNLHCMALDFLSIPCKCSINVQFC